MSEPRTLRQNLWTDLNLLGRAGVFLLVIVMLSFIIPWEPFRLLHGRTPVLWHFAACVLLLMIDIPLALTVWRRRTARTMAVLFLIGATHSFVAAHFEVTGNGHWRPNTPVMLIWTLALLCNGLGRKRILTGNRPGIVEAQAVSAAEPLAVGARHIARR